MSAHWAASRGTRSRATTTIALTPARAPRAGAKERADVLNLGKAGQLLAVEVAERTVVGPRAIRSLDTALLFSSSAFLCALIEEALVS